MSEEKNKYVDAVAKLIKLTQEDKIKWGCRGPTLFPTPGPVLFPTFSALHFRTHPADLSTSAVC
jgi:hypothetical protein